MSNHSIAPRRTVSDGEREREFEETTGIKGLTKLLLSDSEILSDFSMGETNPEKPTDSLSESIKSSGKERKPLNSSLHDWEESNIFPLEESVEFSSENSNLRGEIWVEKPCLTFLEPVSFAMMRFNIHACLLILILKESMAWFNNCDCTF